MAFWRRSIVWSLMAPIPVLAICVLLIGSTLPNRIGNQIVSAAIANAENTVEQFMVLRGYYTKNVISKVIKSTGPKPAIDHADDPRAIPLPATMIHDLSALLSGNGTGISLYSDYPFPNRSSRELDEFQTEAWAYLTQNPDESFVRQETDANGDLLVRVAVADRMTVQACVTCHNNRADTPKKRPACARGGRRPDDGPGMRDMPQQSRGYAQERLGNRRCSRDSRGLNLH